MTDIQSTAAEIRRGKKKERRKKIDITGQKYNIYNFIRHIGSHIQYKKAMYSKQNDEKVNNSVTIFQQHIRVGHIILAE